MFIIDLVLLRVSDETLFERLQTLNDPDVARAALSLANDVDGLEVVTSPRLLTADGEATLSVSRNVPTARGSSEPIAEFEVHVVASVDDVVVELAVDTREGVLVPGGWYGLGDTQAVRYATTLPVDSDPVVRVVADDLLLIAFSSWCVDGTEAATVWAEDERARDAVLDGLHGRPSRRLRELLE